MKIMSQTIFKISDTAQTYQQNKLNLYGVLYLSLFFVVRNNCFLNDLWLLCFDDEE